MVLLLLQAMACGSPAAHDPQGPVQEMVPQASGTAPTGWKELPSGWYLPDRGRWRAPDHARTADSTGGFEARTADLDGDGQADRALFLCRTDSVHPDSSYAVLVQWGAGGDTLLGVFSWAEAQGTIGMGLVLEPRGPLAHLGNEDGPQPPSPLLLEHPALTLQVFEKSAITWFWQAGRCHQVWTAD